MPLQRVARYIQTLRYLKAEQFIYRGLYRLRKVKLKTLESNQTLHAWNEPWNAPTIMASALSDDEGLFFLGEKGHLTDANFWNNPKRSRLWTYNLHYFDSMHAVKAFSQQSMLHDLLQRWIKENPLMKGPGWEPYPLSLRIVNWVKYFSQYPQVVESNWFDSLSIQAEALMAQLEYHILGNHLFANAKALVFVGAYFKGEHATRWLKKGIHLLDREVEEQFLLDGGHFERSPMYHATLLWDMCDLYNLALKSEIQLLNERQLQWQGVILKGLRWLDAMTHPDGKISFFNDATFGIAPKLEDVRNYVCQLGLVEEKSIQLLNVLKQTGYVTVEMDAGTKAILDVGEVGPNYQPGHAHADTLSFELSIASQRVIVNSGISQYGQNETRHAQRSTQAHSTVCIDEVNSSDVWSGFRVARRARPFDLEVQEAENNVWIACSHDGYLKRPGKNIHRRIWSFNSNSMTIHDFISGSFFNAEARFYLNPEVSIVLRSPRSLTLGLVGGRQIVFSLESEGELNLLPARWYPGFGEVTANDCIAVSFSHHELITRLVW